LDRLFDPFVRTREKRRWNFEAEPFGRPLIDREIEFCWYLDRKVGWLGAAQDSVRVDRYSSRTFGPYVINSPFWANGDQPDTEGSLASNAN
jgi:hypothetical protein